MELSEFDKKLLNVLQENLAISKRPFKDIGEKLGVDENFVIERLNALKQAGYIRRIGAFFDSEKLGFIGSLIALRAKKDKIPDVAAAINKYNGVTHNYEREGKYNLWFTLTSKSEEDERRILKEIKNLSGVEEMLNLKAKRKYKINVAFKLK